MSTNQDSGLKVRVYNVAHQNFEGEQDLGNCVLSQLVPDAAERIIAVKIDDDLLQATKDKEYNEHLYYSQLENLNLGNCTEVLLASGSTVYMTDPELATQVRDTFFASQADHCCRYGSLLVSSCTKGIANLEQPITVKIVDFEHESEIERKVAKNLRVGDCHGKISPRLAKMLGGKENTPFQFRLANYSPNSPLPAFIAKGTVAIDSRRTENRGYDLVLDRSSIKGWAENTGPMKVSQRNNQWKLSIKPNLNQQQVDDLALLPTILQKYGVQAQVDPQDPSSYLLNNPSKEALDALAFAYDWGSDRLACGVYKMPELIIGNNSNAKNQEYNNSWQLMQWYSPNAIEQDIVPPTIEEAEYLKSIQNNYRLLAKYLVDNHDKKQELQDLNNDGQTPDPDKNEFGLIEILRADTRGELANHPKIVSFCRDQLRKRWLELATKGAITLESAMAQPADIKPGTIVAPHLKEGAEILVTRYPIINKDNIRRYVVDNSQALELIDTKGCVFINPEDAMKYHQCDFDGDQLVVTPVDLLPTIAAETRFAQAQLDAEGNDLNRDYNPVVKKDKVAYVQTDLKQMALSVRRNSIGRIANAIGRVNCAQPNPEADVKDQEHFLQFKAGMMDVLFDSLQIEVDSPKSAARYTDYYPSLDEALKNSVFALPFFDFKQDIQVYNSALMPTSANPSVVDILPNKINQIWDSCQLKEMDVSQYRYLLKNDLVLDDTSQLSVDRLASNILQNYNDTVKSVSQEKNKDSKLIKDRFARVYTEIKEQIMVSQLSSDAKDKLATVLWEKQHGKSLESSFRRKCLDICKHFDPSIYTYQKKSHEYQRDLTKNQPAYIVEAPFESSLFVQQGRTDCANYIKDLLEAQGEDFEATVHPTKPCVVFAIKNISPQVKSLFEPFNSPDIARHHDLIDIKKAKNNLFNQNRQLYNQLFTHNSGKKKYTPVQIMPPRHMNWLMGQTHRKASLVFSVLPERVSKALGREISQVKLLGKDKNAYVQHDFNSDFYRGRELNFTVTTFNDPASDRHGDPMVYMQNPGDGNYYSLGMFVDRSDKLPVGASFSGQLMMDGKNIDLFIKPGSISIETPEMPVSPKKQRSKLRRQETRQVQKENSQDRLLAVRRKREALKTEAKSQSLLQLKPQSQSQLKEENQLQSSEIEH